MKIRRDKADDLFSKLVRERAGWCCETCHKYFPEGPGRQYLQCSHLFSRRHNTLRWEPSAAWAQCFTCHQRYGSEPREFDHMIDRIFGAGHIDRLIIKKQGTLKVPAWYKKKIKANLQAELNRMLERRAQGERGRLEFNSPY